MKFLLDTCALIRLIDSPDKLPLKALEALRMDGSALMGLSAISLWEVARKESLGNLELTLPVKVWLKEVVQNPGLEVIPLSADVALESCHLPDDFHRDPADRSGQDT